MKLRTGIIVFISTLTVAAALFQGCSKTDDDVLSTQRKNMMSYLDKEFKGTEEESVYEVVGGVYRYVKNQDRNGYGTAAVVEKGDSVEFWFVEQLFTTKPEGVIYTNIPELINEMADDVGAGYGFAEHWPRETMKVKLGSTDMLKGLNRGLAGCREGDNAILLLTADLAYGNRAVSTLPKDASVSFEVFIEKVKKQ